MRIAVTSKNELKINAVSNAYHAIGLNPEIIGYSADSKVGEQPVNEETLQGAKNRISYVLSRVKDLDRIISIENGIFYEHNKWLDKAVVVIYDVKLNKESHAFSDAVEFPAKYVDLAREIGFDKITVGKVMADAGYVKNPKNPHLSISGTSRQVYLEKTVKELVQKTEKN
tara:strand:+ start:98979 stop:99488 length:510 start_codon:yes stop_codon:yes gene_type:complete